MNSAYQIKTRIRTASLGQYKHRRRETPLGFSLIELLVVISIIAVLASLLLPALAKSKGRALQIKCGSNGRQLGLALLMYVDDHEGDFPPSANYSMPKSIPERIWTAKLIKYAQTTRVYSCPSSGIQRYATNWAQRGWGSIGYTTATAFDPLGVEGFPTVARVSILVRPAGTPLFADTPGGNTALKYRGFSFSPYNGLDSPTDPMLGTPLVSSEDLVAALGHLLPPALKPVQTRHNGYGTVIHADGHMRQYTAESIHRQRSGANLAWRFRVKE